MHFLLTVFPKILTSWCYSAIAIAMGQTIVLSTLADTVPRTLQGVSGTEAIAAGAVNLSAVAKSPDAALVLRSIWNTAIVRTMYLSVALTGASIPFTIGMEWLNAKTVAKERKERVADKMDASQVREVEKATQVSS